MVRSAMPRHRLRPLLAPRSVAVVGASPRPGSFGLSTLRNLRHPGYGGRVHPVNPKHERVDGLACYPTLADIPGGVEHAVLSVANARIESALIAAVEAGVAAATIFASAFLESDRDKSGLRERLRAIAREAGLPVCGANCMGFVNVDAGVRATWMPVSDAAWHDPGHVSLISHSGTGFLSLLFVDPRQRHNLCVSAGQELTVTAADYMDYALEQESTRVLALFLEAVRDPEGFRAALDKAGARDVPVVAIKAGRTARSAWLARSHSGALAGDDAAFEAVFDHHGVLRVESWDELAATARLLAHRKRLAPGGLAGILDSGGARAMLVDLADRLGVPFADIGPGTARKLAGLLEYGLEPVNPTDVWGSGRDWRNVYGGCMSALAADEDAAMTVMFCELGYPGVPPEDFFAIAEEVDRATEKPVFICQHWSRMQDRAALARSLTSDVPVFDGTQTFLTALHRAMQRRDRGALPAGVPETPPGAEVAARWRRRLAAPEPLGEDESLDLVADFGVATPRRRLVGSAEEAVAAAAALGGPVALKTAAGGRAHKSDVDGVRLGLAGAEAVRAAYGDMAGRLGPRCLVAAMAPPGVELAAGIVVDPQFGPLVMVAAGGTLVETLRDRRFLLPPATARDARRALDALACRPLLDGARGREAADLEAVATALARLALLARTLGDVIAEADVNPLIAGARGCVAVDALVVPRGGRGTAPGGA